MPTTVEMPWPRICRQNKLQSFLRAIARRGGEEAQYTDIYVGDIVIVFPPRPQDVRNTVLQQVLFSYRYV